MLHARARSSIAELPGVERRIGARAAFRCITCPRNGAHSSRRAANRGFITEAFMMDCSNRNPVRALIILTFIVVVVGGCSTRATRAPRPTTPAPPAIRLTQWRATSPLGYAAEATRRNLRQGARSEE